MKGQFCSFLITISVLSLELSCFLSVGSAQAVSGWNITVIGGGSPSSWTSLALDSKGNPHISYCEVTAELDKGQVKYASWNGAGWDIQTVDSTGELGYPSAALALDSVDNPHIAYFATDSRDAFTYTSSLLIYASWTGSSWKFQTVDSIEKENSMSFIFYDSPSLALDSKGNPHISYCEVTAELDKGQVKYASWNGAGWDIQTVDSEAMTKESSLVLESSLALDSRGSPHITFVGTDSRLMYASWTGSSWDIQTVDSTTSESGVHSLALDSHDNPHIAYLEPSSSRHNNPVKYASWTGSVWDIQTADSGHGFVSLALDMNNNPHIGYSYVVEDSTGAGLGYNSKYASRTGSSWAVQTVCSELRGGGLTALVLDPNGNPHISYYCILDSSATYASTVKLNYSAVAQYGELVVVSIAVVIAILVIVMVLRKRRLALASGKK